MTLAQQIITIGLCVLGTMTTRFLPFLVFRENRETPKFIQYVGKFLPSAVFGMLVVYCLRNVNVLQGTHGIPEFISILVLPDFISGNVRCWYLLQEEPSAIYYCYIFVKRPMHQNQPQIHLPVFSFSGFQD